MTVNMATKSILAENLRAISPGSQLRSSCSRRTRLCWRCQKDKPLKEGQVTKFKGHGGKQPFRTTDKFVCGECLAQKQAATPKAQP